MRPRRRFTAAVTAVLLGGAPLLTPTPARATGAAEVVFTCTAEFAAFPSSAGSGTCGGDVVPGLAVVTGSGVVGGQPYVVAGSGEATSSFSYGTGCVGGEPSLFWMAFGTAQVTGVPAVVGGRPTTASLTVLFQAVVIGFEATIQVTSGSLSFAAGGSEAVTTGAGAAQIVPILQPNNTCPQGGPMEALVVGEVTLAFS